MKATLRPLTILAKSEFWISIFVSCYVFLIVLWLIRDSHPLLRRLADVLSPPVTMLGLEQNWALFSPKLRDINFYNMAMITFRDGSVKLYEWPRMDRSNSIEQAQNEKYRKMFNDCFAWHSFGDFQPAVARFVARANANPENPPVRVALGYFWAYIPKPEQGFTQATLPELTKFNCYYVYQVQPRDMP